MGTTIFKIAQKCQYRLASGDIQSLLSSVIDVYATVVKNEWYENRADGVSEVDGVFVYTFGVDTPLSPVLDVANKMYYILSPSSFLRLPHEMGINLVCYLGYQDNDFARVGGGSLGMWRKLKSNVLGGKETYFMENNKMYFPRMKQPNNILLKLAVAVDYDSFDIDEELNIPGNVVDKIVDLVVQKFQPKPPIETKVLV